MTSLYFLLLENLTQGMDPLRLTPEVVPQLPSVVPPLGRAVLPIWVVGDAVVRLFRAPVGVLRLSVTLQPSPGPFSSRVGETNPVAELTRQETLDPGLLLCGEDLGQVSSVVPAELLGREPVHGSPGDEIAGVSSSVGPARGTLRSNASQKQEEAQAGGGDHPVLLGG